MAGQASTAGVWPAMSTNVVHMAQSSIAEMGHAVRRGEIASPLSVGATLNTHPPISPAPPHYTILGRLICSVAALFCHRMNILTFFLPCAFFV